MKDQDNEVFKLMFEQAKQAFHNSYAPYSNFHVGSCIRTKSGQLFSGANVENVAYPQSQCAEASAIGHMIVKGEKDIEEVVVYTEDAKGFLCTPCGGCRQRLSEFSHPSTLIHICSEQGVLKTLTMQDLLPYSFQADLKQKSA